MKQIIIAGTNELARYYIDVILSYSNMKIIAIIQNEHTIHATTLRGIPIYNHITAIQQKEIDYFFCCETQNTDQYRLVLGPQSIFFSCSQLKALQPFVEDFKQPIQKLKLLLNSITDGLIVVNANAQIEFMNDIAKTILGEDPGNEKMPITELVQNSRLPKVLQHQEIEKNEMLTLSNGKTVISTRVPLVQHKHLTGAFATFKESQEFRRLAEEHTDINEVRTILEAIIHLSDQPVSVVDEHGLGWMSNDAYARITGLSDEEVIGQLVATSINEDENIHTHVLKTRRSVQGAKLTIGPQRKDVLVHAYPIIVQGQLKGSVAVIHDTSEVEQLTMALEQAKQMTRNLEATYTFDDIVGSSPQMTIAVEQAKLGARTPATIILRGASGTGKEFFARAIHHESERKFHQFIRVNCAFQDESSLETQLFGYEAGESRSGGKKGNFEEANKGTIFLDEVGELSLDMQLKLLKVLQGKKITPIGGTEPVSLDVRIIVSTKKNLEKEITQQNFRKELFDILNRLSIYLPPLQKRMEDLPALAHHIIMKMNEKYGRNVKIVTQAAIKKLEHHQWPKNINELENIMSRAFIFMDGTEDVVDVHHLPEFTKSQPSRIHPEVKTKQTLQQANESFERDFILHVYEEHSYNKMKTAEALGISVRNLYYKLAKYS